MKKALILAFFLFLLSYSKTQTIRFSPDLAFPEDSVGAILNTSIGHIENEAYMDAIKLLSPIILAKDSDYLKPALYLRGYSFYKIDRANLACVDWKYYMVNSEKISELENYCQNYSDSIQEVKNRYYPPEYPGGRDSISKLLSYVAYPIEEIANDREGRGQLQIYVNKQGKVYKVEKIEGEDAFATPLINAFYLLNNFTPAKKNGASIDTSFVYTFIFHLETTYNPVNIDEIAKYDIAYITYKRMGINMTDDALVKKQRLANDYYEIGLIELQKENYTVALLNFDNCLNLTPNDIDALTNKGISHYYLGGFDKACISWQHAAIGGDEQATELYIDKCK